MNLFSRSFFVNILWTSNMLLPQRHGDDATPGDDLVRSRPTLRIYLKNNAGEHALFSPGQLLSDRLSVVKYRYVQNFAKQVNVVKD